ncbi:alkaline phosphatase [Sporosarcina sp. NCCP-2222]|uniref:DedA family protein n=1 Tax=Sporosarcina sp. NCCP-2222 TaxID=2935073 RepID=UPI00207E1D58|nr:DedA family protein [Sporosarcina sp. NCCP-2222]GKV56168.1 alkaline phosphatase [Sporosarcina sp. NCCP-2222]
MENWITDFMSNFGYIGICLLILFENVFPPIPSEVILTFGGFMTTYSGMTVVGVILAATAGSVVGAMILFSIGMLFDVERLEKLVDRWGGILRITRKDIHRVDAWFRKFGVWAVLLCRLIPLVRSLISVPAGMARMNFPLFILLTAIGSLAWNTILVLVGAKLGENWEAVLEYMDIYSTVVYILLGIGGIAVVLWYIRFRRKRA